MHSLFGIIASGISGHLSSIFTSLYESFADLTSIINQHFVEWFSGSGISTIWTKVDYSGTGTAVIDDSTDGGLLVTAGASSNNTTAWTFNNKRQYDHQNAEIIIISKRNTTNTIVSGGFTNTLSSSWGVATDKFAMFGESDANTFKQLKTSDGTTQSSSDSSVAVDTAWTNYKIKLSSADAKLYINGVLEVTKTTNKINAVAQPFFGVYDLSAGTRTGNFRFLECYNTTVSILSSLYERLSALTQVMNQRVVEWFGGSALDTARWTGRTIAGAGGSASVLDSVDDGLEISATSGANNVYGIDFNDKRQFAHDSSNFICVLRKTTARNTNQAVQAGFVGTSAYSSNYCIVGSDSSQSTSFFGIKSMDATTATFSASDVALDENWHNHKVTLGASDLKYYIDGVLKVTKTTNRPTAKQMPTFIVQATNTVGAMLGGLRYYEAWNTLTTPTDYPSVYEMFQALTTVAKTRFVDWFSGSVLNPKWTVTTSSGGSDEMADEIDGGYKITPQAGQERRISFNNKRQYAHDNAVMIAVSKQTSQTTGDYQILGFVNASFSTNCAYMEEAQGVTNKFLRTADGTTSSDTATDIARDISWHSYKIQLSSADIKLTIDGVLKVTKTTNRPTIVQQPMFLGGVSPVQIRYIEMYNT